jgi:hypothetical protein
MAYAGMRSLLPVAAVSLALTGIMACGGSTSSSSVARGLRDVAKGNTARGPSGDPGNSVEYLPNNAVARVGDYSITKATLNRWMSFIVGGDFYETSQLRAPKGLISDPPRYKKCSATLKKVVAVTANPRPRSAEPYLTSKCKELYQGIKEQALGYLIESRWSVDFGAEQGLHVSDADASKAFRRLEAQLFPKQGMLERYLADRGWTIPVEMVLVRRELMYSKLKHKFASTGGEEALTNFVREATKKWTIKTTCREGYVVEQCNHHRETSIATRSPAAVIKELTGMP